MDFFSKNDDDDGQAQKTPEDAKNAQQKPSTSDLIHSAHVVADAAQAHFRSEPDKFDKGEVAGAAADLLDAAADYGKLDETQGIGKYVDKAEDYLRHYHDSHPADAGGDKKADDGDDKKDDEGGGLLKMAGDFLKK